MLYDIHEDALKKGFDRITKNLDGAIARDKMPEDQKSTHPRSHPNHLQI